MLMAIVFRQDLGLPSFVLVVAGVHGRENLPVGVHDDVAAQETVFAQDCVVELAGLEPATKRLCLAMDEPLRGTHSVNARVPAPDADAPA
jgi:hypothetical protein